MNDGVFHLGGTDDSEYDKYEKQAPTIARCVSRSRTDLVEIYSYIVPVRRLSEYTRPNVRIGEWRGSAKTSTEDEISKRVLEKGLFEAVSAISIGS
jgi:hypothetical protein